MIFKRLKVKFIIFEFFPHILNSVLQDNLKSLNFY
jgi:hypothetical protein